MKSLILIIAFLTSFASFAGDMSVYCGKGTVEEMEEFTASQYIAGYDDISKLAFSTDDKSFHVTYADQIYTFFVYSKNSSGYKEYSSAATGPFYESELIEGYSCHIND